MIIARLLSPSPLVGFWHHQLYSDLGADTVMESITLIVRDLCYEAMVLYRARSAYRNRTPLLDCRVHQPRNHSMAMSGCRKIPVTLIGGFGLILEGKKKFE